ncbi:hypothetical protein V5799_003002 [Amblyomma americanum]|uniref:Uncharacterized protein n=1 Tax=Amblyomma americanum TaxID=6943 RepID=A0AAQ4DA76_AMBAM
MNFLSAVLKNPVLTSSSSFFSSLLGATLSPRSSSSSCKQKNIVDVCNSYCSGNIGSLVEHKMRAALLLPMLWLVSCHGQNGFRTKRVTDEEKEYLVRKLLNSSQRLVLLSDPRISSRIFPPRQVSGENQRLSTPTITLGKEKDPLLLEHIFMKIGY